MVPFALLALLLAQPATSGATKPPRAPDNAAPRPAAGAPRTCAAMCSDARLRCLDSCRHGGGRVPDRMCRHSCDSVRDNCAGQCTPAIADRLAEASRRPSGAPPTPAATHAPGKPSGKAP